MAGVVGRPNVGLVKPLKDIFGGSILLPTCSNPVVCGEVCWSGEIPCASSKIDIGWLPYANGLLDGYIRPFRSDRFLSRCGFSEICSDDPPLGVESGVWLVDRASALTDVCAEFHFPAGRPIPSLKAGLVLGGLRAAAVCAMLAGKAKLGNVLARPGARG